MARSTAWKPYSRISAMLESIDTPHGLVRFLTVFRITEDELRYAKQTQHRRAAFRHPRHKLATDHRSRPVGRTVVLLLQDNEVS